MALKIIAMMRMMNETYDGNGTHTDDDGEVNDNISDDYNNNGDYDADDGNLKDNKNDNDDWEGEVIGADEDDCCNGDNGNLLPHMPILGSSNSAANKYIMSNIFTNGDAIFSLSRKHEKRRNFSLRAISSLPTMFSKAVCC